MSPIVMAIAGVSGAGKTYLSRKLLELYSEQMSVSYISEDSYFRDQSGLSQTERLQTNYDHPAALEHSLLAEHLSELRQGRSVKVPRYDFHTHNRESGSDSIAAAELILVEGALLLTQPAIRKLLDFSIYLDVPLELCLQRRIVRDISERGRTEESVVSQFAAEVRPMYFEFVLPQKQHADVVLSSDDGAALYRDLALALADGGYNELASALANHRDPN